MTGVAARPDHRDQHPGVAQPARRELGQGRAQAALLVIGVDGEHHDLA